MLPFYQGRTVIQGRGGAAATPHGKPISSASRMRIVRRMTLTAPADVAHMLEAAPSPISALAVVVELADAVAVAVLIDSWQFFAWEFGLLPARDGRAFVRRQMRVQICEKVCKLHPAQLDGLRCCLSFLALLLDPLGPQLVVRFPDRTQGRHSALLFLKHFENHPFVVIQED